jgi:hypothetical protein
MSDDDNELAKTETGVDPVEVADAPTMAAPPELASPENETPLATPVAYTETGEVPVENYPQTGPSPVGDDGQRWLSVVGIAGIVISVATAVTVGIIAISLGHKQSPAPAPAPPTSQPVPAPPTSQPVAAPPTSQLPPVSAAPPLDGTYRIDKGFDKWTINGRLSTSSGKSPRLPSWSEWYGFRSACTAAGCVATGTKLDRNNLQAPDPNLEEPDSGAIKYVLRWVEGAWQNPDGRTYRGVCSNGGGAQTEVEMLSLEPQPDGTYRGTDTTMGYECGGTPGDTSVIPFVAWRIGPPPPSGVVADPPTGR